MPKIPVRHIKEPGFTGGFTIRRIEDLLNGEDLQQDVHRHDFYLLLLIEKGKGNHAIDFVPYPVTDNSLFFLRPGQVHELALKATCSGYLIEFSPAFYTTAATGAAVFRKVSHKNHCKLQAKRFQRIYALAEQVMEEYEERDENYLQAIKARLDLLFIELLRQSKNPLLAKSDKANYAQEKLEAFTELLERNFTTHKKPADYAALLHLSNYQLNALTREAINKSSSEVITDYLLLEAKRQLLATSNQVNQIAYDMGFQDPSYFIRFFKKHTGQSPQEFRSR